MTAPFPNRKSINNASMHIHAFPHSKTRPKLFLLLISMASSIFFVSFLLFFFTSLSSSAPHRPRIAGTAAGLGPGQTAEIQQACRATRYPDACQSMIAQSGQVGAGAGANEVIRAALSVSARNLETGRGMVREILDASARNPNRSRAASTCLEVLASSAVRTEAAADALARGRVRDARAWASAALCYQYDCWSGLKYVNDTASTNATMAFFDATLIASTSNALAMMRALDALGPDPARWAPPRTERDGFWEPVASSGSGWAGPGVGPISGLAPDATVCKGGGCDYETVQAAVDAAPEGLEGGKRFVVRIKEGVYEEIVRVPFNKTNLVFLGDGMGKTVITGSLNTGLQGITTYNTATVGVLGDGFMASGLTIQNTAGPDAHQAVAFRSDSDLSYIENCEFLGNQDTIYVHSLRQLFNSCVISGNVDFVFGNAAAVFQNCTILVRPRQAKPEKGETNAIAAHGRTDPSQTTGFAFLGCVVNGTDDYMALYRSKPGRHKNYLGRPWKAYSRTVYINCTMGELISPEGWLPWSGDFALSTLYYGEYGNSGPGADLSKRVPWSRQIPAQHVDTYTVDNFLQGDEWVTTGSS